MSSSGSSASSGVSPARPSTSAAVPPPSTSCATSRSGGPTCTAVSRSGRVDPPIRTGRLMTLVGLHLVHRQPAALGPARRPRARDRVRRRRLRVPDRADPRLPERPARDPAGSRHRGRPRDRHDRQQRGPLCSSCRRRSTSSQARLYVGLSLTIFAYARRHPALGRRACRADGRAAPRPDRRVRPDGRPRHEPRDSRLVDVRRAPGAPARGQRPRAGGDPARAAGRLLPPERAPPAGAPRRDARPDDPFHDGRPLPRRPRRRLGPRSAVRSMPQAGGRIEDALPPGIGAALMAAGCGRRRDGRRSRHSTSRSTCPRGGASTRPGSRRAERTRSPRSSATSPSSGAAAARSSADRERGSSRPRSPSGAGSSETSTTVRSSDSSSVSLALRLARTQAAPGRGRRGDRGA